jgi:hypothetical protein
MTDPALSRAAARVAALTALLFGAGMAWVLATRSARAERPQGRAAPGPPPAGVKVPGKAGSPREHPRPLAAPGVREGSQLLVMKLALVKLFPQEAPARTPGARRRAPAGCL